MFEAWSRLAETYSPVKRAESPKVNLSLGNGEAKKDVAKNKRTNSIWQFYLVLSNRTHQQFRMCLEIIKKLNDFRNVVNQKYFALTKYRLTND